MQLFQEEVAQGIQSLEKALIVCEKNSFSQDTLQPLMRTAHSLKGAARLVQLPIFIDFFHRFEDLLATLEKSHDFDPLFQALDILKPLQNNFEQAQPAVEENMKKWLQGDQVETKTAFFDEAIQLSQKQWMQLIRQIGLLQQEAKNLGDERFQEHQAHISHLSDSLIELRSAPFHLLVPLLQRTIRDLEVMTGKQVELKVIGQEVSFDRLLMKKLQPLLIHLIQNAFAHGFTKVSVHEGAAERELDAARADAKNNPAVNSQRFFTRDCSQADALAPSVLSGSAPREHLPLLDS